MPHAWCDACRANLKVAAYPSTAGQLTADMASRRATLQQTEKAAQAAGDHWKDSNRQAEMQKLALGSLVINASPGSCHHMTACMI